ncbi:hypothetical protein ACGFZP_13095 [Kitasatospora sp. NPDC048239]
MAGNGDPVPVDIDDPNSAGLIELLSLMTAADGTPYIDILTEPFDEDTE